MPEIRPFLRHDREQLTDLVNAHVKAVIPGCSVPADALLSQMERDPGEYIVDPWVVERETWVAIEDDRARRRGAPAPVRRRRAVGSALRNAAAINWLVCWPANLDAGHDLMRARCRAARSVEAAGSRVLDMSLPAPLVYGIHDAWPHLASARSRGRLLRHRRSHRVAVRDRPRPDRYAGRGADRRASPMRRRLHEFGAAFTAMLNGREIGMLEVDDDFTRHGLMLRNDGWADISNVGVAPEHQGIGVGSGYCITPPPGCDSAEAATSSATSATTSSTRRCTAGTSPTVSPSSTGHGEDGPDEYHRRWIARRKWDRSGRTHSDPLAAPARSRLTGARPHSQIAHRPQSPSNPGSR